jgi:hypothetical protein
MFLGENNTTKPPPMRRREQPALGHRRQAAVVAEAGDALVDRAIAIALLHDRLVIQPLSLFADLLPTLRGSINRRAEPFDRVASVIDLLAAVY